MRLIDADVFKKYIIKGFEEMKSQFKTEFYLDIATRVTESFLEDIDEQPTVEAQPTDAEREAYIKGYDYVVKDWFKSKTQPSEDCISRKAVTDTSICVGISCNECSFNTCEDGQSGCLLKERVDKLPSITPERPKGKWIHPYKSDIACECSECHIQMPITNYYHYCPNCGAEMSGGDSE